jgi:hypothetical protein
MLQRLKRPRGARDLPGGGGEVKQLGAASEVTHSSMRRRQACCVARRVGLQTGCTNALVQLRALWQRGATTTTHSLGCGARMAMEVEHRRQTAALASCSCKQQLEDATAINGNLYWEIGSAAACERGSGSRTGPDSDATDGGWSSASRGRCSEKARFDWRQIGKDFSNKNEDEERAALCLRNSDACQACLPPELALSPLRRASAAAQMATTLQRRPPLRCTCWLLRRRAAVHC